MFNFNYTWHASVALTPVSPPAHIMPSYILYFLKRLWQSSRVKIVTLAACNWCDIPFSSLYFLNPQPLTVQLPIIHINTYIVNLFLLNKWSNTLWLVLLPSALNDEGGTEAKPKFSILSAMVWFNLTRAKSFSFVSLRHQSIYELVLKIIICERIVLYTL